jgi:hypothetical protein
LKPEHAANAKKLVELSQSLSEKQSEVEKLYARWSELSGSQGDS